MEDILTEKDLSVPLEIDYPEEKFVDLGGQSKQFLPTIMTMTQDKS